MNYRNTCAAQLPAVKCGIIVWLTCGIIVRLTCGKVRLVAQ